MFTQFFGNYLLNKKLIEPEQLSSALDYQHSAHIKLGVLAINAGYMTAEQVRKTHKAQQTQDRKFGELAIELGFLDEKKLKDLLTRQKSGHLHLGQALIDKNHMSIEELDTAFKNYKKDYSLTEEQLDKIQKNNINEIIKVFYDFENKNQIIYTDYISLFFRNLIRFIDSNIRPENIIKINSYRSQWLIHQDIKGKVNLFTCIAADNSSLISLAGKFANEEYNSTDKLTQASAGEFLNMNNGIFLVNMSNKGIELDMSPQTIVNNKELKNMKNAYCMPIYFPFGKIDFIISEFCPDIM